MNESKVTLSQAVLDAYDAVMRDPELSERAKDRIACAFMGVPEMAREQQMIDYPPQLARVRVARVAPAAIPAKANGNS